MTRQAGSRPNRLQPRRRRRVPGRQAGTTRRRSGGEILVSARRAAYPGWVFEPEQPVAAIPGPVSPEASNLDRSTGVTRAHKPLFILFLTVWALNWVMLLLRVELPPEGRWLEGLLLILGTATSLVALGRRLPLQNVLVAATLIAVLSTGIAALGTQSGMPFGQFVYGDALGAPLFGVVPWSIPLLWVVLIINGRGVARLILRPWRRTNYYGFWVIGLTCLLAVLFDLGFEPFAVHLKNYWLRPAPQAVLSWHTAPWVNYLGWFVSALGILTFALPWLINKQPIKQPKDYHPLVVWLLLNLWVATGNALEQLWPAAGVGILGNALGAIYAIRGARWPKESRDTHGVSAQARQ